jgi:hypothetical protein
MPHDSVAADVARRVREAAKNRCGYCLISPGNSDTMA